MPKWPKAHYPNFRPIFKPNSGLPSFQQQAQIPATAAAKSLYICNAEKASFSSLRNASFQATTALMHVTLLEFLTASINSSLLLAL